MEAKLPVGIRSLLALGPWPWVSSLLPVLVLMLVKWILAYLCELLWACQGESGGYFMSEVCKDKTPGKWCSVHWNWWMSFLWNRGWIGSSDTQPALGRSSAQSTMCVRVCWWSDCVRKKWAFIWAVVNKMFLTIRFLLHKLFSAFD